MVSEKENSPFKNTFFLLFVFATFISNTGTWLFALGSGWLMTELNSSEFMVSLVQTATLIPLFLLALPAGAIGDMYQQKKIILIAQSLLIVNTLIFAYIVYLDKATVVLLLIFTLLNGVGAAFSRPVMAAIIPQLISKDNLRTAVNFTGMAYNLSRALGPILGGWLITAFALDMPFWIDGISFGAVVIVILFWSGNEVKPRIANQKLKWAMGDSIRFLRYTPALNKSIIRAVLFFFPASALWAFMPLVAREQLSGDANLYGYLLGASGFGAVCSVTFSKSLISKAGSNTILLVVSSVLCTCLFFLGFAESQYLAIGLCFVAGVCWQISFTSLLTSTHYALPRWYGARGMAYFLMAMSGSMALGSAIWGLFAEQTSLQMGLHGAGIAGVLITFAGSGFALDLAKDGNFTSAADLPELNFSREEDKGGWVLVHIIYSLGKADKKQTVEKLRSLKNVRYRGGAIRWKLFTPSEKSDEVVESFYEVSLRQYELHRDQVTQHDREKITNFQNWLADHQGSHKRIHYLEV